MASGPRLGGWLGSFAVLRFSARAKSSINGTHDPLHTESDQCHILLRHIDSGDQGRSWGLLRLEGRSTSSNEKELQERKSTRAYPFPLRELLLSDHWHCRRSKLGELELAEL